MFLHVFSTRRLTYSTAHRRYTAKAENVSVHANVHAFETVLLQL